MSETREIDVYWTIQNGKRFSIALTEADAWASITVEREEDPLGWSVECRRETAPVTLGEIAEGHGEWFELDEEGNSGPPQPYTPVKVFWKCPCCGEMHSTDAYDHPVKRASPCPNPSIWFCEFGRGIVLVHW